MSTKKRSFTPEFKLMIVQQVANGERSVVQVCREHNLSASVYDRWKHQYQEKGTQAFQPPDSEMHPVQEQRIAELERFCGQLALENDLLKKRSCLCEPPMVMEIAA